MAGLIQEQMAPAQQAPQEIPADMQAAQMAPGEDTGPEPDESDPGYQQAMAFAMEALYSNEAARDVAKSLKLSPNKVDALANTAYEIVSIVDEKTDGAIPDELLALFASNILEEVSEIAEAAGIELQPADIAGALKQMILRFLGEQGVDTTQLQQAMDQVNPEEFNRMVSEEEGETEEVGETEEEPQAGLVGSKMGA